MIKIEEVTFEKAVAQAHQKPWPFVPLTIVWITGWCVTIPTVGKFRTQKSNFRRSNSVGQISDRFLCSSNHISDNNILKRISRIFKLNFENSWKLHMKG